MRDLLLFSIIKAMLKLHQFIENINKTQFKGKILEHEALAEKTTMKTGGTAALFLVPEDELSVLIAVSFLKEFKIPYFILGGGSNVVFPDGELEAAVVSTEALDSIFMEEKGTEDKDKMEDVFIRCGAGVKTSDLVDFCTRNGFSGLETFAGLPGTAGGAAFMNARCYGKEMSQIVCSAEYIEFSNIVKNTDFCPNFIERHLKMYHNIKTGEDWAYKHSPFMQNDVFITSITFKAVRINSDKKEGISLECEKYINDRKQKGHFKAPSAGSVFKNNRSFGEPSGILIDKTGLKSTRIGGAQVAPWHGNIIINCGNAKSSDVKALVDLVQEKVRQKTGFTLEPEIIFAEQNLK